MRDEGNLGQDGWRELLEFCERERRRIFVRLEPLEGGMMHTGKRGPGTGGMWVDTTNEDIQRLRNLLADVDSVIAKGRTRTA